MKHLVWIFALTTLAGCSVKPQKATQIAIVPAPVSMVVDSADADFVIGSPITITYPEGNAMLERAANFYSQILHQKFGGSITVTTKKCDGAIDLEELDDPIKAEAYELEVDKDGVKIEAADYSGAVYALQTLLQLMPVEVYCTTLPEGSCYAIPAVEIKDYPRFGWRGMHLDCSRHFSPTEDVKKYIDYLYVNKLNRFHWHFTDDQGWRMESKQYPLLTEKAAWRVDRTGEPWNDRKFADRAAGEKLTYGGFYTQDQIREVVSYAADRGIQVMPEIEIPGHSAAVFAAYPNLSCLGVEQEVTPGGVYPDSMATCYCAGNEDVFTFLEGIIDETIELFPDAPYIHIGGDEVDKRFWANCPKCQARIKAEGLKNVDELQSYFIKRIEKYVNSKGKQIMGWDEILEGGLAPNATVMSWRGIQGGIDAARAGHDVVMTPNSHLYFDYYQNDPTSEPETIGGFITAKRVYEYEPIADALTEQQAAHVLGAQGNMWREYAPLLTDVERMTLTRMAALSEVDWSPKAARYWDDFSRRLEVQKLRYKAMGAAYHKGSEMVDFEADFDPASGAFNVKLVSEVFGTDIHYTLDGSEPTLASPKYTAPISIGKTSTIKAILFKDGEQFSRKASVRTIGMHKGVGKTVAYNRAAAEAFFGTAKDRTLIDGFTGSMRHDDGYMQGFNSGDFDVVVDMGEPTEFNSVEGSFMQSVGVWCYFPSEMIVSVSDDNRIWREVGRVGHNFDPIKSPAMRHIFTVEKPAKGRYVRVVGTNPITREGLPGAGTKNWIFADEIFIN